MCRGEAERDEAAEGDAAHDCPIDPTVIEGGAHLFHITGQAPSFVELQIGGRLIAERKRNDTEGGGQRIDRGSNVLPATLETWDHHQRSTGASFDNPHLVI